MKAVQRDDSDDRCLVYRDMRRTLSKDTPLTTDADQIEWVRQPDGSYRAVALFELTQRQLGTHAAEPPPSYFQHLLRRYEQEGVQGELARTQARALGCHAYIVVFNDDASTLWVYNLSLRGRWPWQNTTPWIEMSRERFQSFLFWLKNMTLEEKTA